MNNMLKTIFVVSVMGGALYGAYVLLNENEFRSRQQAAAEADLPDLNIDFGDGASEEPTVPQFGQESSGAEPAPWGLPSGSESAQSTLPPFPPKTAAPADLVTGGMSETTPEEVARSLGGGALPAGASLPPNVTPIDDVPPNTSPVDAMTGYEPPGTSEFEEPSDLATPPPLDPSPGAAAGGYEANDDTFQPIDGAGVPNPAYEVADPSEIASSGAAGGTVDELQNPASAGGSTEVLADAARQSYLRTIGVAKAHVAEQNYRDALAALSVVYGNPDLPSPEREELHDLLDALAGKVIYSTEHLHQPAYVVQPRDTLESIAGQHAITPEFLARINGLDPQGTALPAPGSSLKVVRGPFRAEVRLRSNVGGTLTLYLGELYAGRFDVELGQDPPFPGKHKVQNKQLGREFVTLEGTMIPGDSPENPYGGKWIDLGSGVSLHGSPAVPMPGGRLGCMALPGEGHADDLFAILAHGATVDVRQ